MVIRGCFFYYVFRTFFVGITQENLSKGWTSNQGNQLCDTLGIQFVENIVQ